MILENVSVIFHFVKTSVTFETTGKAYTRRYTILESRGEHKNKLCGPEIYINNQTKKANRYIIA